MRSSRFEKLKLHWQHDVELAPYSTYKIGGAAKLFFVSKTQNELITALRDCLNQAIPFYIVGKGSNTLFDDRGFDGAVIVNKVSGFNQTGNLFEAYSGTLLSYLATQSAKLGYGGLEFGAGIPGSVGGAIYMNAGANGLEIKDVIERVTFLNNRGEIEVLLKEKLHFDYRYSSFHSLKCLILSAVFKLNQDSTARQRQIEMIEKRKLSQPLSEPSCGCTFRNGDSFITGQLIEELGLKGLQVGGAQISTVHANFIVNKGGAKAQDVKDLVSIIEDKVREKTSYKLSREIRYVPFSKEKSDAL